MQYIFISKGGQGTSFLLECFRKAGYSVGRRPDIVFKKHGIDFLLGNPSINQAVKNLDELPDPKINDTFYKRSGYGFHIDNKKSINDNLLDYICSSNSSGKMVLFNNVYKLKFFSSNNISNVIALVRHPLHAYMSYIKPERHYRDAILSGGIDSKMNITRYLSFWNSIINEIMLTSKRVIRYEFFYEDAEKVGLDISIFDGWDTSKRNENILSKEKSDFLYKKVKNNYFKIYDKWDIG